jgi:hypothetical protein
MCFGRDHGNFGRSAAIHTRGRDMRDKCSDATPWYFLWWPIREGSDTLPLKLLNGKIFCSTQVFIDNVSVWNVERWNELFSTFP